MPACLVSGIFHTRLLSQVRAKIFLSLIQVLSQIGHIFGIAFPPIFAGVLKWAGVLQLCYLAVAWAATGSDSRIEREASVLGTACNAARS